MASFFTSKIVRLLDDTLGSDGVTAAVASIVVVARTAVVRSPQCYTLNAEFCAPICILLHPKCIILRSYVHHAVLVFAGNFDFDSVCSL